MARVRRALGTRAVGHTGTLDPFATGLLVILVGRATRLARYVEPQAKTYLGTARLGVGTTTDDPTGEALADPDPVRPERDAAERALQSFRGPQRQRPPAFSAKHVEGERSYRKARRGEAVVLAEVEVTVHAIELVGYQWPELVFRATVSAGTYVRALARDLGGRLGTAAHLTALRRERIGGLGVEQAIPLERLGPGTPLLPPLAVLGHLGQVEVTDQDREALGYGRAVPAAGAGTDGPIALVHGGRLLAIAREREGRFHPEVVLEPAS